MGTYMLLRILTSYCEYVGHYFKVLLRSNSVNYDKMMWSEICITVQSVHRFCQGQGIQTYTTSNIFFYKRNHRTAELRILLLDDGDGEKDNRDVYKRQF